MPRIWELPVDYTKLTRAQRREVRLQYINFERKISAAHKELLERGSVT